MKTDALGKEGREGREGEGRGGKGRGGEGRKGEGRGGEERGGEGNCEFKYACGGSPFLLPLPHQMHTQVQSHVANLSAVHLNEELQDTSDVIVFTLPDHLQ